MAGLGSGVLLKFLKEMGGEANESDDSRKPVLLQIRSIIPVLSDGDDLWPNQGFFLKVSDSSHAAYLSLPQDQNDMVLCNRLQLGQFISVRKLEAADPVPILQGMRLLPGRHSCSGDPQDLVSAKNLERFCGMSELKIVLEESHHGKKKNEEGIRSSRVSKAFADDFKERSRKALSCTRKGDTERKCWRMNGTYAGDEVRLIDNESNLSASRRRSWNFPANLKIAHIPDSVVIKHEIQPIGSGGSAGVFVAPVRPSRYDRSDDNSSPKPRKKENGIATRSVKSYSHRAFVSKKSDQESFDTKWTDISWDSLPSALAKLGQEVLRQRDMAIVAAIDGLQEASASEKLLKCLSAYSELQTEEGGDSKHISVGKFFKLQKALAQTKVILHSLTNMGSSLRANCTDPNHDFGSIREVLKLGLDRKKNATSWIEAALASNLTPPSPPNKTKKASLDAASSAKKSSKASFSSRRTKGTSIIRMQRLAAENENLQADCWVKGSASHAASELERLLNDECRASVLAYVESYLDEFDCESIFKQSHSDVAEKMREIERVSDLLDVTIEREGDKDSSALNESELEPYGRLKDKISKILLKHLERTAMTF